MEIHYSELQKMAPITLVYFKYVKCGGIGLLY